MFNIVPLGKNNLIKRERELTPIFENFFEDNFFPAVNYMHNNFKVDLRETEKEYLLEAELPGIKKENINLEYENNYLLISAVRNEDKENQQNNYVRRERYYGEFKRSFYIDNIDEEKIDACFNDGVLVIVMPKITQGKDKKKKIDIN